MQVESEKFAALQLQILQFAAIFCVCCRLLFCCFGRRHCTCCVPSANVHSLRECTSKCGIARKHAICIFVCLSSFRFYILSLCLCVCASVCAVRLPCVLNARVWWMTSVRLNFLRIPFSIRIKSFHLPCSTRMLDARTKGIHDFSHSSCISCALTESTPPISHPHARHITWERTWKMCTCEKPT